MSFGSGSGGGGSRHSSSSFGGKGSSQRKERKRKQEFHRHKIKYVEEQHLDFEQLKSRAVTSLERLGQQVFSAEPGGYGFEDWMKSYNFLLDDFEEKVGVANLPKEYFDKRVALTSELLTNVETSDIDKETNELQNEEDLIKSRILQQDGERRVHLEAERSVASSKLGTLSKERDEYMRMIDDEKKRTHGNKKDSSSSFFKKLFSRSAKYEGRSDASNQRISKLESEAKELEQQIDTIESERSSMNLKADSENKELIQRESARLEEIKARLGELSAIKSERIQIADKRKLVTAELAATVSKITVQSDSNISEIANPVSKNDL